MANKAILCPRCRRLIGSQETVCSWCGASRANPLWMVVAWTHGALGDDWVVPALIIVNIVFYVLSLMLTRHQTMTPNPLSLLAPGETSLLLLGASGTVPVNEFGRFWSFLSANYLHGGILHIVFNMVALRRIAPLVIQEFGISRMFTIYTIGGIGAYMLSYMAGVQFSIGASAAICSLIGSLLYYGKSRGGAYGAEVFREVGGWLASLFLFGLIVPGINNWGHGGGILCGIFLGMLLGYNERRRETLLHRYLAISCVLATIVCLIWAVIVAVVFRLVH